MVGDWARLFVFDRPGPAAYAAPTSPPKLNVVETCIVLLIKIGVIEQELPQFPAPMPASRGLTNHSFEKRSFVPVVVTVHAPFVDVNAAANVDPHTGFEPKFSVQKGDCA